MTWLQTCRNVNQLHNAYKIGNLEEVTSLLSNEEYDINSLNSLNTDGESSLHIACKYGHFKIVKVLLNNLLWDLNAQNSHGDTPLHLACNSKSLGIVRLLRISHSMRMETVYFTLHVSGIKLLLEGKCSTNIPNMKGETTQNIPLYEDENYLLHIACQWGDVGSVRQLITHERCNPNVGTTAEQLCHPAHT